LRRILPLFVGTLLLASTSAFASLTVTAPTSGSTNPTSVHFVASATPSTGHPISSLILYVDGVNKYTTYSATLDHYQTIASGLHTITIKSWDSIGTIQRQDVTINVVSGTTAAGVTVTSPSSGTTSGSPVHVVASAKSSTSYAIDSMIAYVDKVKVYTVYAAAMDTNLTMTPGTHDLMIKSWDKSGVIQQTDVTVTVNTTTSSGDAPSTSIPSNATVFSNIDQMSGWQTCDACAGAGGAGPTGSDSMTQNQSSPSLDGKSMKFWIGGSTPYTDYLFHKTLLSESQLTQNRNLHHFIYDTWMYVQDPTVPQNIEWDINQFVDGKSFILGTQCAWRSSHTWDIWDNVNSRWVDTGVYCALPKAYAWNHVVIEAERTSDNQMHYISVSLNGDKHIINKYYPPKSTSWSGVTVNYQMDGNSKMQSYTTWLDKFTLTAW